MSDLKDLQQKQFQNKLKTDNAALQEASKKLEKSILRVKGETAPDAQRHQELEKILNDSKAILDSVSESIEEAAKAAAEIEKSIVIDPKVLDSINQYLDNTAFFKSVTSEIDWTIFDRMTEVKDWLIRNNFKNNAPIGIIAGVARRANAENHKIPDLMRQLKEKLDSAANDPEATGITIYDVMRSYATGTFDISAPISINAIKTSKLLYPLDTVNSKIWTDLALNTIHSIKAEKTGSKKQLSISYSIDFDALGNDIAIAKELTTFDKRVYMAAASLHDVGNGTTTLSQIYEQMGYNGKPSQTTLDQINAALTKMGYARITVDNKEEASVYNYPKFVYDGPLLPFERVSAVVNGKTTDAAIHFFRQPPLITFAQQRKQITTIDLKLLQSPISKTDTNLAIDDYLLHRILRAKNQQHRILFKTLYEKVGITTAKQKQRTPNKVKTLLDHYKKCGYLSGYSIDPDGVTVFFAKA